jgi:hypothetical protein
MKITPAFNYISGLLTIAVICIFYYCSTLYSLNIPWFDDIENIPYFVVNWLEGDSFSEKWQALILPNNEHRVVAARLVVLAQYYIAGSLNFKVLVFLGNLTVLGFFSLFVYNFSRQSGKLFLVLPAAFLIFNLQSYLVTFMTIMSMQYQMVLFLTAFSFIFLAKRGSRYFLAAVLIAYLDTFSMGNGMMVWPSGLVILLFQTRWRDAMVWIVAGGLSAFFYFSGHDFVQGNDKGFDYIIQHPVSTFTGFFTMLGGVFDVIPDKVFSKRMILPFLGGLFFFSVFLFWLVGILSTSGFWGRFIPGKVTRFYKSFPTVQESHTRWNSFWLGILTYALITTVLIVFFRTRFDYQIVLWSTYKMYPNVFAGVVYLLAIQAVPLKRQLPVFLISCVIASATWIASFINYLPIAKQTSYVRTAFAHNQRRNNVGLGAGKDSPFEKMVIRTLHKADSLHVYSLPRPVIHADENNLHVSESATGSFAKVEIKGNDNINMIIKLLEPFEQEGRSYVIMESAKNLYLLAIDPNNWEAVCPLGTIRAGEYKIGIWNVDKSGTKVLPTQEKVTIQ